MRARRMFRPRFLVRLKPVKDAERVELPVRERSDGSVNQAALCRGLINDPDWRVSLWSPR